MLKRVYDEIYNEIRLPKFDFDIFDFKDTKSFMLISNDNDRFEEQKIIIKRVAEKIGMDEQSLLSYLIDVSFEHIKSFKKLEELIL